jgi:hypothetical protein
MLKSAMAKESGKWLRDLEPMPSFADQNAAEGRQAPMCPEKFVGNRYLPMAINRGTALRRGAKSLNYHL